MNDEIIYSANIDALNKILNNEYTSDEVKIGLILENVECFHIVFTGGINEKLTDLIHRYKNKYYDTEESNSNK